MCQVIAVLFVLFAKKHPSMEVLELLNRRQSDNRADFARRKSSRVQSKDGQPFTSGLVVGTDANRQLVLVQLDNGQQVYCRSETNGVLTPGTRTQVTLTDSGIGWVSGMPRA